MSGFGKAFSTGTSRDNDVSKTADTDSGEMKTHFSSRESKNGDAGLFKMIDDNVMDINKKMGVDDFTPDASNCPCCKNVDEDSSASSDCDFENSSSSCSSVSSEKNNGAGEAAVKKVHVPGTKGEFSQKDLPKAEALTISVLESELKALGKISSMVEEILIVESFKNSPVLNKNSVLFSHDGKAVGNVFKIWGPVVEPCYSIRFNSFEELKARGFALGDTIYFVPENKNFTLYVEALHKQKGLDASGRKHAQSLSTHSMGAVPKKRAVQANNAPFQMPNHQMRPPFNRPVQNSVINVPGMTLQSLNSMSSAQLTIPSTSSLSTSASHQGPQLMKPSDNLQTSNPATSSAAIRKNTPLLYHPGKFTTPLLDEVQIVAPSQLPHSTNNNISSIPTMSFNGFPPRIPNGTAYTLTSNPSFLQLNSNTYNAASLSLHQPLGINSAASQIYMNRGNIPVAPLQTIPPQTFVTSSSTSIRSVCPGLQYHIQHTVSSSITTNVSGVPRIPGIILPPILPTSVPARGWHPFHQPMIGMLPNGIRGNVLRMYQQQTMYQHQTMYHFH